MSAVNAIWDANGNRQAGLHRSPSDASYLPVRCVPLASILRIESVAQYHPPNTAGAVPHNSQTSDLSSASPEAEEEGPWEDIKVDGLAAGAAVTKSRLGVPSSQDSDSLGTAPSQSGAPATAHKSTAPSTTAGAATAAGLKGTSPHASIMRRQVGQSTLTDAAMTPDPYFRPPITTNAPALSGHGTPTMYQLPPLQTTGGPLWQLPPRSSPKPAAAAALAGLGDHGSTVRRGASLDLCVSTFRQRPRAQAPAGSSKSRAATRKNPRRRPPRTASSFRQRAIPPTSASSPPSPRTLSRSTSRAPLRCLRRPPSPRLRKPTAACPPRPSLPRPAEVTGRLFRIPSPSTSTVTGGPSFPRSRRRPSRRSPRR
jgi:hypothetical protein